MLRDIQRMSWMPSGTGVSIGKSTKSFDVTTAFTPGSASAFEVSMPRITASGCGLLSTLDQIISSMVSSAATAERPVTLSEPTGRIVGFRLRFVTEDSEGERLRKGGVSQ